MIIPIAMSTHPFEHETVSQCTDEHCFQASFTEQLGRRLDKDDLDEGLKMNETKFRFFLRECNKTGKRGVNHFIVIGFDQCAYSHQSGELLEKGRKEVKYKDISSIYNGAFKASKESGTHDNFGDTAAVEANPWLNYPICLLIEERGANSDELRRQPLAVFSDSTRGRPHSNSSASSCIRQRRDRGGGEGSGREKKKQKVW